MAAETCSVQFNADQLRKVARWPLLHSAGIFTLHSSHHPAAHTFFPAPAEGTYLIANKYTTEVFGKVFQIIGQVMTKAMKIQNFYINNI